MARNPFTGSGRAIEGGALAARKQDFVAHGDGNYLRHHADHVDMNPELNVIGLADQTVQGTLEKMANLISQAGQGFITIGDGYDMGDFNVGDPATPTLESAFIAAFAHTRLQNGGVVLVKSGTYRLGQTVTVPSGITIMGEPSGTFIISATNQQAMFEVEPSPAQFELGKWLDLFSNKTLTGVKFTKFYNLILADNLDGYKGASPTIPNSITTGNLALIQCNRGSYVICERVSFLGRVNENLNPAVVSRRAIDYINNSGNPTALYVENCYFDAFENCITFTPGAGALDFLAVRNCRMRWCGHNVASPSSDRASAISFTLCNANIENNYMLGENFMGATTAIHLQNTTLSDQELFETEGATDKTIPRVIITGNTGGLTADLIAGNHRLMSFFVDSSSNKVYRSVIQGNQWGANGSTQWYTVIGDGKVSIGDLIGPSSIDIAALFATLNVGRRSEQIYIVNPGDYTVTRAGTSSQFVKLIGNVRSNGQRPVLTLDTSSTDSLSRNTFYVGNELRNIKFKSTASFHSVTLNVGSTGNEGRHFVVDNCDFEDVGLIGSLITNATTITNGEIIVDVSRCRFNQENTFANNISFLMPSTYNQITLRDSVFTGYGYAVGVGDSGAYTETTAAEQNIRISNVLFDADGDGNTALIDAASPLSNHNYYIWVDNVKAKITFDNVKVEAVNGSNITGDAVASALKSAGSFTKYMYINASDITVDNSIILGPPTIYTDANTAFDHSLITLFLTPINWLKISNCEIRGSCPIQVGGACFVNSDGVASDKRTGAYCAITNSTIAFYNDATEEINTTLFDLDIPDYPGDRDNAKPLIIVDNCQFENYFEPRGFGPIVQHTNNISSYTDIGLVQIYAKGYSVRFTNNLVHCVHTNELATTSWMSATGSGAVVIDTLGNDDGTSGNLNASVVHMSNNDVMFDLDGSIDDLNYHFSNAIIKSAHMTITDNYFFYRGHSSVQHDCYRTYLWIKSSDNVNNNSGGIISNNIFDRFNSLSRAFVVFESGYVTGRFVENIFNNATLDGTLSTTVQFIDNTDIGWVINNNRNQYGTIRIVPQNGIIQINDEYNTDTDPDDFKVQLNDSAYVDGYQPLFITQSTSGTNDFIWAIQLAEILPFGTRIKRATASVTVGPAWSTAGTMRIRFDGNTSNTKTMTFSCTSVGTSGQQIVYNDTSQAETLEVSPENKAAILLDFSTALQTTTSAFLTINYIELEYLM